MNEPVLGQCVATKTSRPAKFQTKRMVGEFVADSRARLFYPTSTVCWGVMDCCAVKEPIPIDVPFVFLRFGQPQLDRSTHHKVAINMRTQLTKYLNPPVPPDIHVTRLLVFDRSYKLGLPSPHRPVREEAEYSRMHPAPLHRHAADDHRNNSSEKHVQHNLATAPGFEG